MRFVPFIIEILYVKWIKLSPLFLPFLCFSSGLCLPSVSTRMFPKITGTCLLLVLSNGLKMRPTSTLARKRYFSNIKTFLYCSTTWRVLKIWCLESDVWYYVMASTRWWTIESYAKSWRFQRWSLRWSLPVPLVNHQKSTPSSHLHPAQTRGKVCSNSEAGCNFKTKQKKHEMVLWAI